MQQHFPESPCVYVFSLHFLFLLRKKFVTRMHIRPVFCVKCQKRGKRTSKEGKIWSCVNITSQVNGHFQKPGMFEDPVQINGPEYNIEMELVNVKLPNEFTSDYRCVKMYGRF